MQKAAFLHFKGNADPFLFSEVIMNIHHLTRLAILTSAALILFLIELRLPAPVPIPGVKLGLANIITIYAVYRYKPSEVFLIVAARILLGSFFAGQMTVIFYSTAGAVLCLGASLCLCRILPERYLPITSALGAVFHNTGQLAAASILMGTGAVILWYPYLVLSGILTGLFTGFTVSFFIRRQLFGFHP